MLQDRVLFIDGEAIVIDKPAGLPDDRPRDRSQSLEDLLAQLAGEGKGLLISTHEVDQASRWDLVLCLNRTQIAFGRPEAVLTRPVLERTYGEQVVELPGGGRGVLPAHHCDHEHEPA